jgi:hypothetical protein
MYRRVDLPVEFFWYLPAHIPLTYGPFFLKSGFIVMTSTLLTLLVWALVKPRTPQNRLLP